MIIERHKSRWTFQNILDLTEKYKYPARIAIKTGVSRSYIYRLCRRYDIKKGYIHADKRG